MTSRTERSTVEFLRTWTASNEEDLLRRGIALSLVFPHDPSAVAVAVLFAELQPSIVPTESDDPSVDVMGQLALAADGLCLIELLDTESGETLYKSAETASDESQLHLCLTGFVARMRS